MGTKYHFLGAYRDVGTNRRGHKETWAQRDASVQWWCGWLKILPVDSLFRAACQGDDPVHMAVRNPGSHQVKLWPPEVLDLIAADHPVPDIHMVTNVQCVVSSSPVGVAGSVGRLLLHMSLGQAVCLLESLAVLSHPVDDTNSCWCRPSLEVVDRQSGLLPKQEKVGREPRGGVRRVVVRLHQFWQVYRPPGLAFWRQRPEQVVHGAIESLTLSISLWVIGGRPGLLDPIVVTQQLDQPGFKVTALVTVDALWNPILLEPFCDQDFGLSNCLLVACGDSQGVLGEDICHHQDIVLMVAGRLQLGEVDGEDFQGATGQQWSGRGVQRGRKAAHGTAFAVANIVFDLVKHPRAPASRPGG